MLDRLEAGEKVPLSELYDSLPPSFREVATSGDSLSYATRWLNGEISPWYAVETQSKAQTVVEKLIARANLESHNFRRYLVVFWDWIRFAGDQVLCSVAFRGMHEYRRDVYGAVQGCLWGDTGCQPRSSSGVRRSFCTHR